MSFIYKGKIARWDWYEKDELSSTNDEIKHLVGKNPQTVLSAVRQTKGRGRRGHTWQEITGNLYMTFTLEIPLQELSRYVCLIGLSLAETVKNLAPAADVQIKWPNDVFLNKGKLSGILLENISQNLWGIGIGVNVAKAPKLEDSPYKAASLKENGIILDRTDFLCLYLNNIAAVIDEYQAKGFAPLKAKWLSYALNLHQEITIKNEKTAKKGLFLTLDDNGYLILKTKDKEEQIIAGDLFI